MKVKELKDLINQEDDLYSLWDAEDIIPRGITKVANGLDLDQRRWFSTATDVYKCEDGFVGVNGVFQVFSEGMPYSDCGRLCVAFECEAVQSVTYKPKGVK